MKSINSTLTSLAPVIHSIAEREYAMCWMLSGIGDVTPQTVGEKGVNQERIDECYQGFYKLLPLSLTDALYTGKPPVLPDP